MSEITEQQLESALRLFEKYANKEIEYSELLESVSGHAATVLSSRKLIGFDVTQMASGRLRIRPISTSPITPLGEQKLAEINKR